MDFERLFGDLENQFDAMLAQRDRQSSCRAVELALQKTAPRELGGGARRILLTSPHLGADFVSGLEPKEGAWYALRLELVRSLRMLPSAGGLPGFAAELTRGAETLAQLSQEWVTPLHLRLFCAGDEAFEAVRVAEVNDQFLVCGIGDFAVNLPLTNLLAVGARLGDFSVVDN
ncbi:MAG: hypothetical protein RL605_10 [Actinomycetota bacterium]|jgi:hypothetical protein